MRYRNSHAGPQEEADGGEVAPLARRAEALARPLYRRRLRARREFGEGCLHHRVKFAENMRRLTVRPDDD
jgi:hypothetical protein